MVRQHFITKYKIRRAVEEDNDDLVPLINTHSTRLQETYGEFYISEILTQQEHSSRQLIVAEHGGIAVAVLCLNEQLNLDYLNDKFELAPYYALRKTHPDDDIQHGKLTQQISSVAISTAEEPEEEYVS